MVQCSPFLITCKFLGSYCGRLFDVFLLTFVLCCSLILPLIIDLSFQTLSFAYTLTYPELDRSVKSVPRLSILKLDLVLNKLQNLTRL